MVPGSRVTPSRRKPGAGRPTTLGSSGTVLASRRRVSNSIRLGMTSDTWTPRGRFNGSRRIGKALRPSRARDKSRGRRRFRSARNLSWAVLARSRKVNSLGTSPRMTRFSGRECNSRGRGRSMTLVSWPARLSHRQKDRARETTREDMRPPIGKPTFLNSGRLGGRPAGGPGSSRPTDGRADWPLPS